MNKSDIRSGNVFAVPLLQDFGYAYVKLIEAKDCVPIPTHYRRLVKLYNRFEKQLSLNVDLQYFETDDILIAPIILGGTPPLRGKDKWIYLGDCNLTDEDRTVPHVHEAYQGGVYHKDYLDLLESKGSITYLTEEGERRTVKHFSHVRHLRSYIHSSALGVQSELSIFWMDRLGHSFDRSKGTNGLKDYQLNWGANIIRSNSYDISAMPKVERLRIKKQTATNST